MSENILRTNCESCAIELTTLDLRQEPDLILCELCKPWVLDSIYQVPDSVVGIPIKNPEMFRLSLKLMEDFDRTRTRARLANLTLRYIFEKILR